MSFAFFSYISESFVQSISSCPILSLCVTIELTWEPQACARVCATPFSRCSVVWNSSWWSVTSGVQVLCRSWVSGCSNWRMDSISWVICRTVGHYVNHLKSKQIGMDHKVCLRVLIHGKCCFNVSMANRKCSEWLMRAHFPAGTEQ